jgi:hypothetical protein
MFTILVSLIANPLLCAIHESSALPVDIKVTKGEFRVCSNIEQGRPPGGMWAATVNPLQHIKVTLCSPKYLLTLTSFLKKVADTVA